MAKTKRPVEISIETKDDSKYVWVLVGREHVGLLEAKAGGYVVFGCRKVIPNFEDAAREVVWKRAQRLMKEAAELGRAALEAPLSADAVDPHADIRESRPRA